MKKAISTGLIVLLTLALCSCSLNAKESPGIQPDAPASAAPADTNALQWQGEYKNEEAGFAIDITECSGTDFLTDIFLLRNGHTLLAGTAAISAEDSRLATLEDVVLRLSEDGSAIEIDDSESAEWAHMSGQYIRVG